MRDQNVGEGKWVRELLGGWIGRGLLVGVIAVVWVVWYRGWQGVGGLRGFR